MDEIEKELELDLESMNLDEEMAAMICLKY
jgi:hypothetical protein